MLLHNYPYHREAGYLAQVFPHVYADLGLATHNVGSRAPAVLAEALEMAPLRKFLFSSDAFGLRSSTTWARCCSGRRCRGSSRPGWPPTTCRTPTPSASRG